MPIVTDRIQGASASLAFKAPVRCASTGTLTLSGFQTIDGITPTSTEHVDLRRVLVKDQSSASGNGIYDMQSGAWTRAKDFDSVIDFRKGTRIYVANGTANSSAEYVVSNAMDPLTFSMNVTSITFSSR
jgi:hypothetical protein